MYSAAVVATNITRYEQRTNTKLKRIPIATSQDIAAAMRRRLDAALKSKQQVEWSAEDLAFRRNERIMCALDFSYFGERYATIQRDGGGITTLYPLWGSQQIALNEIASLEEKMFDAAARGEPVDGILIAWHKARQLGATALGRTLMVHRSITQKHRRCMAASVDDDKIQELYDRDKLIIDNLPDFLRPELSYDEKRAHIYFEGLNSRILYQVSSQKSGLGTGRQFDLGHLTECSTWLAPEMIELDFFPTLPQSQNTLCLLESTAYGRGNWWHDFTERVRRGLSRRWRYVFIPVYAEESKYRAQPPAAWQPSEVALLYAQKVHDTSEEFTGKKVMVTKEHLYWWESTRAEHLEAGRLNVFYTNYAATPEESFQHSAPSAFDSALLEQLRIHARSGRSLELLERAAEEATK